MAPRKSYSIRMSDELKEYCESYGDNLTAGVLNIIEDHRAGIKADLEAGIAYLAKFFTSVVFREPKLEDL